ncbi:MAG TPA: N-6 DNA methylase [Gemmataceae bacterium]|jgi:type I restriction-modification system DNA methylase subunit|nr:N-6 DNA methylase [Gemmataceae bacterium]
MKPTTLNASNQVLAVLRQSTIDQDGIQLPYKLDRKDYVAVNKFLETAGASWNRKAGKHVFGPTSKSKLDELLNTGKVVDEKKTFNAFFTPTAVAERLADLAEVNAGHSCLEPSAGQGAIANVLRQRGCQVQCVELNSESVKELKRLDFPTVQADFLTYDTSNRYDRIIMNPPFAQDQDVKHVTHALKFLKPGGKLVSIMAKGWTFGTNKARVAFRQLMEDMGGEVLTELPSGTFKEAGTRIATVVVGITKN